MTEVTCSLNQMSCVMCLHVCVCVHNAYVTTGPWRKGRKGGQNIERLKQTCEREILVTAKSLEEKKALFNLHFIWRYKVVSSTQDFSLFLPGKSPALVLLGVMVAVRWEGRQTF